MEAAIESIPSVGFSLMSYSMTADFEPAKKIVTKVISQILKHSSKNCLRLTLRHSVGCICVGGNSVEF